MSIRGNQIMTDRDLAELYGVETAKKTVSKGASDRIE